MDTMEALPHGSALPPRDDDIIAATETAIRDATMKCAEEVLRLASGLLQHGTKAATRGLHLIEGSANIQAQMLRILGMAKAPHRRSKSIYGGYQALQSYDPGDAYEDPESFTGDAIGETFGNKALKQIIAMFKPIMQQGGLLGIGQKAKGDSIESLTKALAEANKANLDQSLRDAILDKLKEALSRDPSPALAALPAPQPEVDPPMFVCGEKEGV
jgi:hypothetical protein